MYSFLRLIHKWLFTSEFSTHVEHQENKDAEYYCTVGSYPLNYEPGPRQTRGDLFMDMDCTRVTFILKGRPAAAIT